MLVQKFTFLPHCWVCSTPFGPSVKEERHHLIPRAYGGIDGPQVSLCDSHHSALHEIALRIYNKRSYHDLLTKIPAQDQKLLYLASIVYNARVATEGDPNKKQMILFSPNKEVFEKLRKLKRLYPKLSRQALIEHAISQLYHRHFIK